MKKMFVLFSLLLFALGVLSAQVSRGGTAWVSTKSAELKASANAFAASKGTLPMGTQVTVLQVSGNWAEVRSAANASQSGWTAISNLSNRRIVSSGSGASASEVALAGKGFNQEVENSYKAGGKLNYADVDKTEAITVSKNELYQFITEGRLVTGE
jgi:hypothetical protein